MRTDESSFVPLAALICAHTAAYCPISNDASTVVSSYIAPYLPSAFGRCVLASVTVSTGYRVDGNRRLATGGFGGSLLIRRRFAISRSGTASFAKGSAALSCPALCDFRFLFFSVCACRAPLSLLNVHLIIFNISINNPEVEQISRCQNMASHSYLSSLYTLLW
ncbi:hypothetical protein QTP88_023650 [Uroleucon formosanum]